MLFFEKVNPMHPDKIADRIAGALGDLYYKKDPRNRWAIEVLIGHGNCYIISEATDTLNLNDVKSAVCRIAQDDTISVIFNEHPQDKHLADNQNNIVKCGDNGIFKGYYYALNNRFTNLVKNTIKVCKKYYELSNKTDGKVVGSSKFKDYHYTVCQSNIDTQKERLKTDNTILINPLGDWTGGLSVDTGATNRKLGSDMGESVTGGGLHGKDLSKADVSVNIFLHLLAQEKHKNLQAKCSIGDKIIIIFDDSGNLHGKWYYDQIVETAKKYINLIGGFEKFAEWGLLDVDENGELSVVGC